MNDVSHLENRPRCQYNKHTTIAWDVMGSLLILFVSI